jgi:hypothetical protein
LRRLVLQELLLTRSDRHRYVSVHVANETFYNEDAVRGADELLITEGVTDCISALQVGVPCISPVTVRFRKQDHRKLVALTDNCSKVMSAMTPRPSAPARPEPSRPPRPCTQPADFDPAPAPPPPPHPKDPRLPAAGTVLTKEHGGEVHAITVLADGFEYAGETYPSLARMAKVITGTSWNGFLWFGLDKRKRGKKEATE